MYIHKLLVSLSCFVILRLLCSPQHTALKLGTLNAFTCTNIDSTITSFDSLGSIKIQS